MVRAALLALAFPLLSGPPVDPAAVDYRLGVELPKGATTPVLDVEVRLRGDASGETKLDLPDHISGTEGAWRYLSDLKVDGARVTAPDPAHRVLTHRPGARLTIRYRVQTAYDHDPVGTDGRPSRGPIIRPNWLAVMGENVFVYPSDREAAPATFHWLRLPKDWRAASDLEHGAMGRPMTVLDVEQSVVMASPTLQLDQQSIPGGTLRVATLPDRGFDQAQLLKDVSGVISAQRTFWNDLAEPYFVAVVPLTSTPGRHSLSGSGRGDGFVLYATPGDDYDLRWTVAHEHIHTWIPKRTGTQPSGDAQKASVWFSEGFTEFFADRTMLKAGLAPLDDVVGRLDDALRSYDANPARSATGQQIMAGFFKDPNVFKVPYQRGQLLALKWDEAIRLKTGGKADLSTALRYMRDHYQQFPPGQGPDVVTGLVSAVWVTAGIDLRPDIAKYADGGAAIDLPDEMFGGCLQARVTVSPAFDPGFDTQASFAGKALKGVRRGGPAWNSGLRDGMALDSWTFNAGDTTRQVELVVRGTPARGKAAKAGKPRKVAFWPYGDADASKRKLQLTPGMTAAQTSDCGRRLAGL